MTIGLLGASGKVGRTAADRIARAGLGPMRLGGRDAARAEAVAAGLPGEVSVTPVDVDDPASLERFCAGCRVVVNCAGPSYRVLDTVARAAWAAGADHVDIGGELAARRALSALGPDGGRRAVFSAGAMPGLSGLLPRLLTGRPLRRLDSYVGGAAAFTPLSAVDALLTRGEAFGVPLAAMRDDAVTDGVLSPLRDVRLPGFAAPMHAWPYLTTEAQALEAAEVRAYNVFSSPRIAEALATAWAEIGPESDPQRAAAAVTPHAASVVGASAADVAEHGAFYTMLFSARPLPQAPPGPTRVLLTCTDSYALSGIVMALATAAVLEKAVPTGAHLAAQVLDPMAVADALRADPVVDMLTIS